MKKITVFAVYLTTVFYMLSCSTKKNTTLTRTYHNLTAYYNVYFNGADALKNGVRKIDDNYKDNYSLILPVFKFSSDEAVRVAYADMNRVIEKGSKCIRKHSITVKPKRKESKKRDPKYKAFYNQKEFNKWVDDSYMLIGKANFYKHDYYPAIETFNYIVREYSEEPIKYEAYLWLARTYVLMEKYDKALDFLSKLDTDKDKVPEELKAPIALTKADILIRNAKYEEAIPFMEDGVKYTKKKRDKARYMYILAQLYQEVKNFKDAYDAYGKVAELSTDYEMTFNARINRASIFNTSAGDSKGLQKQLMKMLKDDKNIDYRDQIYYALGNIASNEGRKKDAINYYLKSAAVSTQNTNQKGMSYLAAADIYYEHPDYKNSQMYYDSAVTFLSKEYPEFINIKNKSENLNDLVKNIVIIEREDSLQRIALMPEAQRNATIDKIIADVIEEERKQKELEAQQRQDMMYTQQQGRQNSQSSGAWYFYNPAMISLGQSEFKQKWGDRKNEDNWRRKNKIVIDWDTGGEELTAEADTGKNQLSNKTREYYMYDLPLTDSAMEVSQKKVEEAYFNMATIYKDQFHDFAMSIKGYLDLLDKYPNTEYKLTIYYNLYKLYYLSKEYKKAEEYKQLIINQYPDSDYAKVLSDPDYFKCLEQQEKQVNFMYQATYKYFISDNCEEVNRNYKYADSVYKNSKLLPKFALLATLCKGHSGDTTAFKNNLREFINMFPNTSESEYANEVLAALDREQREVILEPEEESGFGNVMTDNIDSLDISIYTFEPYKPHLYLSIVANEKANANQIKFNLENFNLDYYSFLNFTVESELLSADYTLITVLKFRNRKMGSNYFESVQIAGDVYTDVSKDAYLEFLITPENYKTLLKDKNILRYKKFYETNYNSPPQDVE